MVDPSNSWIQLTVPEMFDAKNQMPSEFRHV